MLYARALGVVELAAGLNEDANTHLAEAIALSEQVGFREPSIWRETRRSRAAAAAGTPSATPPTEGEPRRKKRQTE
jgi:hypothetical protein